MTTQQQQQRQQSTPDISTNTKHQTPNTDHRSPITNLVERDDERGALGPQEVEALDRLRLQAVHQIHHEDGDVAERATSRAQVGEGLVTGRVDHEHTGQLHVHLHRLVQLSHLFSGVVGPLVSAVSSSSQQLTFGYGLGWVGLGVGCVRVVLVFRCVLVFVLILVWFRGFQC